MRALVLSLAALAACGAPAFNGVVLEPPDPAPALTIADSAGRPFDLRAERGKVVLLFFGYTHCPDVCPTTLVDWRKVRDSLRADAGRVRFVFVSVDPERDTPASAQRYVARFAPEFIGLATSRPATDSLLAAWKLAAHRDDAGRDTLSAYTVSHPSQVFVVDGAGLLRLMLRPGLSAAQVAADVRALL
jgi:protein SCO1